MRSGSGRQSATLHRRRAGALSATSCCWSARSAAMTTSKRRSSDPAGTSRSSGTGSRCCWSRSPISRHSSAYQFDAVVDGGEVAAVAQPFRIGPRGSLVVVIGTDLVLIPWRDVLMRFAWAIALGIVLAALLAAALARRLGRRLEPLESAPRASQTATSEREW